MVPTFTCGLLRSNFSFAISFLLRLCGAGALARIEDEPSTIVLSNSYITSGTSPSVLVRFLQSWTNKTLAVALDRKLLRLRKAVAPCSLTLPGSRQLSPAGPGLA